MKKFHLGQTGFTLIEIVIAIAITGVAGAGAAMTIGQTFQQNQRATASVQAISEVENVAHWMNQDALMAQDQPVAGTGFLTLTWQAPDSSYNQIVKQAVYSFSGTNLLRTFSATGSAPIQAIVARNIDSDPTKTYWSFDDGVLRIQVTAAIGDSVETREFRIELRVNQPT